MACEIRAAGADAERSSYNLLMFYGDTLGAKPLLAVGGEICGL